MADLYYNFEEVEIGNKSGREKRIGYTVDECEGYYKESWHKSINGRRFSLYGKFYDSAVIVDTSLYGQDYVWFVDKKQASIYLKHKLIIS